MVWRGERALTPPPPPPPPPPLPHYHHHQTMGKQKTRESSVGGE